MNQPIILTDSARSYLKSIGSNLNGSVYTSPTLDSGIEDRPFFTHGEVSNYRPAFMFDFNPRGVYDFSKFIIKKQADISTHGRINSPFVISPASLNYDTEAIPHHLKHLHEERLNRVFDTFRRRIKSEMAFNQEGSVDSSLYNLTEMERVPYTKNYKNNSVAHGIKNMHRKTNGTKNPKILNVADLFRLKGSNEYLNIHELTLDQVIDTPLFKQALINDLVPDNSVTKERVSRKKKKYTQLDINNNYPTVKSNEPVFDIDDPNKVSGEYKTVSEARVVKSQPFKRYSITSFEKDIQGESLDRFTTSGTSVLQGDTFEFLSSMESNQVLSQASVRGNLDLFDFEETAERITQISNTEMAHHDIKFEVVKPAKLSGKPRYMTIDDKKKLAYDVIEKPVLRMVLPDKDLEIATDISLNTTVGLTKTTVEARYKGVLENEIRNAWSQEEAALIKESVDKEVENRINKEYKPRQATTDKQKRIENRRREAIEKRIRQQVERDYRNSISANLTTSSIRDKELLEIFNSKQKVFNKPNMSPERQTINHNLNVAQRVMDSLVTRGILSNEQSAALLSTPTATVSTGPASLLGRLKKVDVSLPFVNEGIILDDDNMVKTMGIERMIGSGTTYDIADDGTKIVNGPNTIERFIPAQRIFVPDRAGQYKLDVENEMEKRANDSLMLKKWMMRKPFDPTKTAQGSLVSTEIDEVFERYMPIMDNLTVGQFSKLVAYGNPNRSSTLTSRTGIELLEGIREEFGNEISGIIRQGAIDSIGLDDLTVGTMAPPELIKAIKSSKSLELNYEYKKFIEDQAKLGRTINGVEDLTPIEMDMFLSQPNVANEVFKSGAIVDSEGKQYGRKYFINEYNARLDQSIKFELETLDMIGLMVHKQRSSDVEDSTSARDGDGGNPFETEARARDHQKALDEREAEWTERMEKSLTTVDEDGNTVLRPKHEMASRVTDRQRVAAVAEVDIRKGLGLFETNADYAEAVTQTVKKGDAILKEIVDGKLVEIERSKWLDSQNQLEIRLAEKAKLDELIATEEQRRDNTRRGLERTRKEISGYIRDLEKFGKTEMIEEQKKVLQTIEDKLEYLRTGDTKLNQLYDERKALDIDITRVTQQLESHAAKATTYKEIVDNDGYNIAFSRTKVTGEGKDRVIENVGLSKDEYKKYLAQYRATGTVTPNINMSTYKDLIIGGTSETLQRWNQMMSVDGVFRMEGSNTNYKVTAIRDGQVTIKEQTISPDKLSVITNLTYDDIVSVATSRDYNGLVGNWEFFNEMVEQNTSAELTKAINDAERIKTEHIGARNLIPILVDENVSQKERFDNLLAKQDDYTNNVLEASRIEEVIASTQAEYAALEKQIAEKSGSSLIEIKTSGTKKQVFEVEREIEALQAKAIEKMDKISSHQRLFDELSTKIKYHEDTFGRKKTEIAEVAHFFQTEEGTSRRRYELTGKQLKSLLVERTGYNGKGAKYKLTKDLYDMLETHMSGVGDMKSNIGELWKAATSVIADIERSGETFDLTDDGMRQWFKVHQMAEPDLDKSLAAALNGINDPVRIATVTKEVEDNVKEQKAVFDKTFEKFEGTLADMSVEKRMTTQLHKRIVGRFYEAQGDEGLQDTQRRILQNLSRSIEDQVGSITPYDLKSYLKPGSVLHEVLNNGSSINRSILEMTPSDIDYLLNLSGKVTSLDKTFDIGEDSTGTLLDILKSPDLDASEIVTESTDYDLIVKRTLDSINDVSEEQYSNILDAPAEARNSAVINVLDDFHITDPSFWVGFNEYTKGVFDSKAILEQFSDKTKAGVLNRLLANPSHNDLTVLTHIAQIKGKELNVEMEAADGTGQMVRGVISTIGENGTVVSFPTMGNTSFRVVSEGAGETIQIDGNNTRYINSKMQYAVGRFNRDSLPQRSQLGSSQQMRRFGPSEIMTDPTGTLEGLKRIAGGEVFSTMDIETTVTNPKYVSESLAQPIEVYGIKGQYDSDGTLIRDNSTGQNLIGFKDAEGNIKSERVHVVSSLTDEVTEFVNKKTFDGRELKPTTIGLEDEFFINFGLKERRLMHINDLARIEANGDFGTFRRALANKVLSSTLGIDEELVGQAREIVAVNGLPGIEKPKERDVLEAIASATNLSNDEARRLALDVDERTDEILKQYRVKREEWQILSGVAKYAQSFDDLGDGDVANSTPEQLKKLDDFKAIADGTFIPNANEVKASMEVNGVSPYTQSEYVDPLFYHDKISAQRAKTAEFLTLARQGMENLNDLSFDFGQGSVRATPAGIFSHLAPLLDVSLMYGQNAERADVGELVKFSRQVKEMDSSVLTPFFKEMQSIREDAVENAIDEIENPAARKLLDGKQVIVNPVAFEKQQEDLAAFINEGNNKAHHIQNFWRGEDKIFINNISDLVGDKKTKTPGILHEMAGNNNLKIRMPEDVIQSVNKQLNDLMTIRNNINSGQALSPELRGELDYFALFQNGENKALRSIIEGDMDLEAFKTFADRVSNIEMVEQQYLTKLMYPELGRTANAAVFEMYNPKIQIDGALRGSSFAHFASYDVLAGVETILNDAVASVGKEHQMPIVEVNDAQVNLDTKRNLGRARLSEALSYTGGGSIETGDVFIMNSPLREGMNRGVYQLAKINESEGQLILNELFDDGVVKAHEVNADSLAKLSSEISSKMGFLFSVGKDGMTPDQVKQVDSVRSIIRSDNTRKLLDNAASSLFNLDLSTLQSNIVDDYENGVSLEHLKAVPNGATVSPVVGGIDISNVHPVSKARAIANEYADVLDGERKEMVGTKKNLYPNAGREIEEVAQKQAYDTMVERGVAPADLDYVLNPNNTQAIHSPEVDKFYKGTLSENQIEGLKELKKFLGTDVGQELQRVGNAQAALQEMGRLNSKPENNMMKQWNDSIKQAAAEHRGRDGGFNAFTPVDRNYTLTGLNELNTHPDIEPERVRGLNINGLSRGTIANSLQTISNRLINAGYDPSEEATGLTGTRTDNILNQHVVPELIKNGLLPSSFLKEKSNKAEFMGLEQISNQIFETLNDPNKVKQLAKAPSLEQLEVFDLSKMVNTLDNSPESLAFIEDVKARTTEILAPHLGALDGYDQARFADLVNRRSTLIEAKQYIPNTVTGAGQVDYELVNRFMDAILSEPAMRVQDWENNLHSILETHNERFGNALDKYSLNEWQAKVDEALLESSETNKKMIQLVHQHMAKIAGTDHVIGVTNIDPLEIIASGDKERIAAAKFMNWITEDAKGNLAPVPIAERKMGYGVHAGTPIGNLPKNYLNRIDFDQSVYDEDALISPIRRQQMKQIQAGDVVTATSAYPPVQPVPTATATPTADFEMPVSQGAEVPEIEMPVASGANVEGTELPDTAMSDAEKHAEALHAENQARKDAAANFEREQHGNPDIELSASGSQGDVSSAEIVSQGGTGEVPDVQPASQGGTGTPNSALTSEMAEVQERYTMPTRNGSPLINTEPVVTSSDIEQRRIEAHVPDSVSRLDENIQIKKIEATEAIDNFLHGSGGGKWIAALGVAGAALGVMNLASSPYKIQERPQGHGVAIAGGGTEDDSMQRETQTITAADTGSKTYVNAGEKGYQIQARGKAPSSFSDSELSGKINEMGGANSVNINVRDDRESFNANWLENQFTNFIQRGHVDQ